MNVLKPQELGVTKNKKPRMRSFLGHFNFPIFRAAPYTNWGGDLGPLEWLFSGR